MKVKKAYFIHPVYVLGSQSSYVTDQQARLVWDGAALAVKMTGGEPFLVPGSNVSCLALDIEAAAASTPPTKGKLPGK